MKRYDTASIARTLKWVGTLLGVAFLVAGAMALFLKTEDPTAKEGVMRFAELGLLGLSMVVVAAGFEAILGTLGRIEEKTSDESEDDDTDILA